MIGDFLYGGEKDDVSDIQRYWCCDGLAEWSLYQLSARCPELDM